jgi:hypothetical protein
VRPVGVCAVCESDVRWSVERAAYVCACGVTVIPLAFMQAAAVLR